MPNNSQALTDNQKLAADIREALLEDLLGEAPEGASKGPDLPDFG